MLALLQAGLLECADALSHANSATILIPWAILKREMPVSPGTQIWQNHTILPFSRTRLGKH